MILQSYLTDRMVHESAGIGNHSRGQAALPAAVRSFLNENG